MGKGTAMLVAKPRSLREALRTLELCAKADVAVLPQGPIDGAPGLAVGGFHQGTRPGKRLQFAMENGHW